MQQYCQSSDRLGAASCSKIWLARQAVQQGYSPLRRLRLQDVD